MKESLYALLAVVLGCAVSHAAQPPLPITASTPSSARTDAEPRVPASNVKPKPRARELGIPLDGEPGPLNAITDVEGVVVGHATIIRGHGELVVGEGPVRTGVTAVFPDGEKPAAAVFAAWHALNANGEMTGTAWVEEGGAMSGPVMITNTHSVGVVRDAVIEWMISRGELSGWSLPVVAETFDGAWPPWGGLNDINGLHVTKMHAFAAMDGARGGPVQEGSVGGGTGMICNEFKGGIGTSSRLVRIGDEQYMLGVLGQCNYGNREDLKVAGVPVGRELTEPVACYDGPVPPGRSEPRCGEPAPSQPNGDQGSIIVVVATDAPLLPHQLERVARRVTLGLGRMGSVASNSSGDIFIAFSTATQVDPDTEKMSVEMVNNDHLRPIFAATVQATEEAILNAMLAADTMVGADDYRVPALPHGELVEVLKKYNRYVGP